MKIDRSTAAACTRTRRRRFRRWACWAIRWWTSTASRDRARGADRGGAENVGDAESYRRGEGQPGNDREPQCHSGQDEAIVDNIQRARARSGKLINDPELYNKATLTIDQLQKLMANLNEGKGSAGKLLHDDELYNRLNDTGAKLEQITTDLNNGKGSAGKLLKDDAMYNNLNSTLKHANCPARGGGCRQGRAGPADQGSEVRQEAGRHGDADGHAADQREHRQGNDRQAGDR